MGRMLSAKKKMAKKRWVALANVTSQISLKELAEPEPYNPGRVKISLHDELENERLLQRLWPLQLVDVCDEEQLQVET